MNWPSKYFFSFIAFVFALILSLEIINGRFWLNDFKVYYGAAAAYTHGEQVYQRVFGEDTGLYKYSPVLLWIFAPATVLPYFIACIFHFILVALAFVFALRLAFRLAAEYFQFNTHYKTLLFFVCTIFTLNHLFRELHLGNVNVLLVSVVLLAFHLQEREQFKFSGFLFALAILAKPYFIVLFVPFVLTKNLKLLASTSALTLIILALFTFANGIDQTVYFHKEWLMGMMNHSEFLVSSNTFQSILQIWFSVNLSGSLSALILLTSVLMLFFVSRIKMFAAFTAAETYLLFCIVLAIIPCLVITDTEHFLFALPLIVFLMLQILQSPKFIPIVIALIFLLAYGVNLGDVIGDALSVSLEHSGFLGIGTIGLVVMAILASKASSKQNLAPATHV